MYLHTVPLQSISKKEKKEKRSTYWVYKGRSLQTGSRWSYSSHTDARRPGATQTPHAQPLLFPEIKK